MSDEDNTPPPPNIITQVSRDNNNNSPPPPPPPLQNQGFFSKLFSCFCCQKKTQDLDTEGTQEVKLEENTVQPPQPPSQVPPSEALLPPIKEEYKGRKTLVLDFNETLVHSSFKPIPNPDFIVPVEIDDVVHKVYVLKRPGVDDFMKRVGSLYEVVVFTASLSKYADPVLNLLDVHNVVQHRLFRESCSTYKGNYVKDLSRIGRDLNGSLIIDNSPSSYMFSQENAIPIETWFDDPSDTELIDLIPLLEQLSQTDNVRAFLVNARKKHQKLQINRW